MEQRSKDVDAEMEQSSKERALLQRLAQGSELIAQQPPHDNLADDPSADAAFTLLTRQASHLNTWTASMLNQDERAFNGDEDLLEARLDDIASIAMSKFHAYRFDQLPSYWKHIYTEALVLISHLSLLQALSAGGGLTEESLDSLVEHLDRALITTGGVSKTLGPSWIEKTLDILERIWQGHFVSNMEDRHTGGHQAKRQKLGPGGDAKDEMQQNFSAHEPYGRPALSPSNACSRYDSWTMETFEKYVSQGECKPMVLTDLTAHWPALTSRKWDQPSYLLSKTIGGRRLVPVEIGRSYVDEDWGQEVITFRDFLTRYIISPHEEPVAAAVGYLAQHNLFTQIPSLRNDISIPDLCWASVPLHPFDPTKDQAPVEAPHLNAWFGPARTITPLHTDGFHNLLCQVVGTKYVRLYPPEATEKMRPRQRENGIDMSNTSEIDVGVLEGWDQPSGELTPDELEERRRELDGVEFKECVLGPGETLFIPIGWWHYVRSLSISFSVSFWWN